MTENAKLRLCKRHRDHGRFFLYRMRREVCRRLLFHCRTLFLGTLRRAARRSVKAARVSDADMRVVAATIDEMLSLWPETA